MTPRDRVVGATARMRPGPSERRSGRPSSRRAWRAAAVLVLLVPCLATVAGCDPRMALYFLQPFEPKVDAPGPKLKDKRVVVITKAVPNALNDFATLDRELTREFCSILKTEYGKKIEVVDTDKVYAWDQAHPTWTNPAELATAFDADYVVFFEVGHFQISDPSSPAMYQGNSSVHIHVVENAYPTDDRKRPITDLPKETKVAYTADKDTIFPTHNPMPVSSEVSPTAFKNKFLKLVATELSWNFVDHAPGDDIQDISFHES